MSYDSGSCSKCNDRRFVMCKACDGSGYSNSSQTISCTICGSVGEGAVPCPRCNPYGSKYGTDPYN